MTFLRYEMSKFVNETNLKNIYMPEWSESTMWGGASLLKMHLRVMQEIVEMKRTDLWNWDYVINLSESDFPIKFAYIALFNVKLIIILLLFIIDSNVIF